MKNLQNNFKQQILKNKMAMFKIALFFISLNLFIFLPLQYKMIYLIIFVLFIVPFFTYVNFYLFGKIHLEIFLFSSISLSILSRLLQCSIFSIVSGIVNIILVLMFFMPEIFIFLYNCIYIKFRKLNIFK